MKTSLAIVLAAAALMLSATVGLKSGEATARFDSYSNKSPGRCGVVPCVYPDQALIPSRPGPGPYRGQM
jgi:hypothetical protein